MVEIQFQNIIPLIIKICILFILSPQLRPFSIKPTKIPSHAHFLTHLLYHRPLRLQFQPLLTNPFIFTFLFPKLQSLNLYILF
jgi:hypothetical protein